MENEVRSNMKCPECGRTVNTFDVVCPECGTPIDDTELDELLDPEAEYSDSFEQEYRDMYSDDVESFRNLHTTAEYRLFDDLIEQLREACREVEKEHIELKRLYRLREKLKDDSRYARLTCLLPLAGTLYEHQRRHVRGICWVRHIANTLSRGVPVKFQEDWDSAYFDKVLSWLPLQKSVKEDLKELFENW